MAEGLRTQIALQLALAAALAACSDPAPTPPSGPPPRRVDSATFAADQLVGTVLEECHAPLRGQMDRVAVTIDLPGGDHVQAFAELPHSLRIAGEHGKFLLRAGTAFALEDPPRPATADETARLRDLLTLVDRAAFGPLHRATGCRRRDATSFDLAQPDGSAITLHLRPDTLLPAAFDEVTIDDYLRTPFTWIARRLTHPRLGCCELVFEQSGVRWQRDFFAAPDATPSGSNSSQQQAGRIKIPAEGIGSRSPTPVLVEARAVRWLVLADPGDWAARARAYTPLHELLLAEDQRIAGFPILTELDGEPVLAIPFRSRSADRPPELPPDTRTVGFGAGRELVVYPPAGDFEARRQAGTAALRAALRASDLEAEGEIRCQPYFHLQEGPPSAAKLENPVVRVSARIR